MTTRQKIEKIKAIMLDIEDEAINSKTEYTDETCPLNFNKDHYANSQIVTGIGCWKWECPFCKETFYA